MLQKGIIVWQRGGGKAKSSASGWRERAGALSMGPGAAAEARPAAEDRLVPARSPPWLLTRLNHQQMERGRGREIAPCLELGKSIISVCIQSVYCTPNTIMLFHS